LALLKNSPASNSQAHTQLVALQTPQTPPLPPHLKIEKQQNQHNNPPLGFSNDYIYGKET
jgi:hypothetical protein